MENIITGIGDVGKVMTAVFGIITGNPLLSFFVAVSVAGIGFAFFKKGKRAAAG